MSKSSCLVVGSEGFCVSTICLELERDNNPRIQLAQEMFVSLAE